VDVRVPSEEAQNFLGSGATGVKPFGVFTYGARVRRTPRWQSAETTSPVAVALPELEKGSMQTGLVHPSHLSAVWTFFRAIGGDIFGDVGDRHLCLRRKSYSFT
jgi:hypothetical protein